MTRAEAEAAALALPAAAKVTLWGRKDVYKVHGKVFAIWDERDGLSFKATEIAYAVLTDGGPGRPAPGFIPGGWVAIAPDEVELAEGADWIKTSYRLAATGLSRKQRAELGLA